MLKDFVAVAGPLGVTHFTIFSKTPTSISMVRLPYNVDTQHAGQRPNQYELEGKMRSHLFLTLLKCFSNLNKMLLNAVRLYIDLETSLQPAAMRGKRVFCKCLLIVSEIQIAAAISSWTMELWFWVQKPLCHWSQKPLANQWGSHIFYLATRGKEIIWPKTTTFTFEQAWCQG